MQEFNIWLAKMDEGKKKWIPKDLKKGSFTDYCGGKVTDACIEKGKKSDNPTTKKRANLANTFRNMDIKH